LKSFGDLDHSDRVARAIVGTRRCLGGNRCPTGIV